MAEKLWRPTLEDYKYRRGTVGLVTGSEKYPGAGVLCARAAHAAGAGLARFYGAEVCHPAILITAPEVVFEPGACDAAVVGCGWSDALMSAAQEVLQEVPAAVIDAGALMYPALWNKLDIKILTPHIGEAARMLGRPAEDVAKNPAEVAQTLATRYQGVVAIKSGVTHVASPARVWSFEAQTTWGGIAGSGDVLAGVIGATLARAMAKKLFSRDTGIRTPNLDVAFDVACLSVQLHSEAAFEASGSRQVDYRGRPITAGQIVKQLPEAVATLYY